LKIQFVPRSKHNVSVWIIITKPLLLWTELIGNFSEVHKNDAVRFMGEVKIFDCSKSWQLTTGPLRIKVPSKCTAQIR